jgi:3-isopropylmalate/(R)-2-methylmalate dehydratase small subunit
MKQVMTMTIHGRVYLLPDHVGADDILAPEYLSFDPDDPDERRFFGAYALASMADLCGPFVETGRFKSPYSIILAGHRFGHGSARPHSPLALAEAGVRAVLATSFAEGFHRAAVNGGYLLPILAPPELRGVVSTGDELTLDLAALTLHAPTGRTFPLPDPGVTTNIVAAGGLTQYVKKRGVG